jgi:hypothetical protein
MEVVMRKKKKENSFPNYREFWINEVRISEVSLYLLSETYNKIWFNTNNNVKSNTITFLVLFTLTHYIPS